jgi:hypothetical protein
MFVCYLHHEPHEIIRSIFFNDFRKEIVKVSVNGSDNFTALRCYATALDRLCVWTELFTSDEIAYPGFIEFDGVNGRCLIHEGKRKTYKLRALQTYEMLTQVAGRDVFDMKMTIDMLLVVGQPNQLTVPVRLIRDKEERVVSLTLDASGDLELIDRYELCVFVKQHGNDLKIHDLGTGQIRGIPNTAQCSISDFLFLYSNGRMIIKRDGEFNVYTLQGEFLLTLAGSQKLKGTPLAFAFGDDLLLATAQDQFDQWIDVFSLRTGRLLLETYIPPNVHNGYKISAIAYDESSGTIVTGDGFGTVTFWG